MDNNDKLRERISGAMRQSFAVIDLDGTGEDEGYDFNRGVNAVLALFETESINAVSRGFNMGYEECKRDSGVNK